MPVNAHRSPPPPNPLFLPSTATAERNCLKITVEKAACYILTQMQRRHVELLFTLPPQQILG